MTQKYQKVLWWLMTHLFFMFWPCPYSIFHQNMSCTITASRRCVTMQGRLCSTCGYLNGPFRRQPPISRKHSCGSERSLPSRHNLDETDFGGCALLEAMLQRLERDQYSEFFQMQMEKCNSTARQRCMKLFVWKYFLILVTRKWVVLSGLWNVLPSASDLVCAWDVQCYVWTETKLSLTSPFPILYQ